MEVFYTLTMETKTGKVLYLSLWDGKPKRSFDFSQACYWDHEESARKFAKRWFKDFTGWKVKEIKVNMDII